jgi:peptidoglycan/xylan/chitin deacetylase (PgdA/CDA1 family)
MRTLLLLFVTLAGLPYKSLAAIRTAEMEVAPPAEIGNMAGAFLTGADWPEGHIALTFDDGPHATRTHQVLEILRKHGVKATFFLCGMMAQIRPQIARDTLAEGHTIGTHSHDHPNFTGIPFAKALTELRTGIEETRKALGVEPAPFFRFPYLAATAAERAEVAKQGLTAVGWNNLSLSNSLKPVDGKLKRGILVSHDTQLSEQPLLEKFLNEMEQYGYTAVLLVPKKR